MKRLLLASSLLCLAVAGCNKEGSDEPTKKEILTQASWKFDNAGFDLGSNGSIDFPLPAGLIEACALDNTVTFAANGTGTVDEGATKCSPSDPQTEAITWSFGAGETTLNVSSGGVLGVSGQFKIAELTSTKLSLSRDTSSLLGSGAIIANFKH